MGSVELNGYNLHDNRVSTVQGFLAHTYVDNVVRPIGPVEDRLENYDWRDGAILLGSFFRCPEITLGVWFVGNDSEKRHKAIRQVFFERSGVPTGPVTLKFSDDLGRYYKVIRTGAIETVDYIDSTYVTVTFKSIYPWLLGETKTVQNDATFEYRGVPTPISGIGTITPSSATVYLSVNGSYTLHLVGMTTGSAVPLRFDAEATTCNQAVSASTKWPYLTYSSNARMGFNGATGSVTFTYTERWL